MPKTKQQSATNGRGEEGDKKVVDKNFKRTEEETALLMKVVLDYKAAKWSVIWRHKPLWFCLIIRINFLVSALTINLSGQKRLHGAVQNYGRPSCNSVAFSSVQKFGRLSVQIFGHLAVPV